MKKNIFLAKTKTSDVVFDLSMANRHGLISGATGTGKTVTLQTLAQGFSEAGVAVFLADIKGDLSGLAKVGSENTKIKERLQQLSIVDFSFKKCPVVFWDVFGQQGHPARCTISDMGPLLLSKILNLNDVQEGVLQLIFKVADDKGLLLLDFKDLQTMLKFTSEHSADISKTYGLISPASIGAIQRALVALESQGVAALFGEPMLNVMDFIQTDTTGQGQVNILAASTLMQSPRVYAIFLLWMLSELFESLPEAGDLDKPKIVFFFDEAHLLFNDAPKILLEKIEHVVRLIRSKGVGIYFVTQNPLDIPETVLAQLSNRIQHALRAFTPKDQKTVKTVADTMRANSEFKTADVIMELGVGEALVSLLDNKGTPNPVERAFIIPPSSQIGPIDKTERQTIIQSSVVFGHYEKQVDRESAFEKLSVKPDPAVEELDSEKKSQGIMDTLGGIFNSPAPGPRGGRSRQTVGEAVLKSAARTVGNEVGRQLIRGVLGSLLGGTRKR